jgi:hypothetical protein
MIIINGWDKIYSIFPIVEDVSVVSTSIIQNPTVHDMLGLKVRPKVVYVAHFGIHIGRNSIGDGIYSWLDVIVFTMGNKNKLQLGMGKRDMGCQIVTPIPTTALKTPESFLEFVKSTFNSSLKLVL